MESNSIVQLAKDGPSAGDFPLPAAVPTTAHGLQTSDRYVIMKLSDSPLRAIRRGLIMRGSSAAGRCAFSQTQEFFVLFGSSEIRRKGKYTACHDASRSGGIGEHVTMTRLP